MPGVQRDGDAATCDDPNTGSFDVFADGAGITRVGLDGLLVAGAPMLGLNLGPGSQSVFANGLPVSLPGDILLPHPCCGLPTCSKHCAATTKNESTTVFAGTGFPTQTVSTGGEGGTEEEGTVAPDVVVTDFVMVPITVPSDVNTGLSPPTPAAANYTITNAGTTNTGPFTVGFFQTDETAGDGPFMLTEEGADIIGATLLDSKSIGGEGIPPFGSYSDTFEIELGGLAVGDYVFSVYADIYEEIFEPDEDNISLAQRFTVT